MGYLGRKYNYKEQCRTCGGKGRYRERRAPDPNDPHRGRNPTQLCHCPAGEQKARDEAWDRIQNDS